MSKFVMADGQAFPSHTGNTKKMDKYLKICNTFEIPEGSSKVFKINDTEIVVIQTKGNFYALDNRCSHQEGPLGLGRILDRSIICPWHGARFELQSGRLLEGPNCKNLKNYIVQINQDETGCPALFLGV